jgi:hypothetical protein
VFSTVSVVLAVLQRFYDLKAGTALDNYVAALSVALGFFVVIISLIEWGNAGAVKGEALYRNAEELTEYQRKLGQVLSEDVEIDSTMLTGLREEYEQIKKRCPFNHDPIDDALFQAEHKKEFGVGWLAGVWTKARAQVGALWYFGFLWLVVAALVWQTPWSDLSRMEPATDVGGDSHQGSKGSR